MQETPNYGAALVLASCATLIILLVVMLCLSSCTMQQLKFWERGVDLLEHYAIEEAID